MRNITHLMRSLFVSTITLLSTSTFAQVTEEWVVRHNGSRPDGARSLALDKDGNVYITGESLPTPGAIEFSTIKYNAAGEQQWEARYGAASYGGISIAVDRKGYVYVTGDDLTTIKYNPDGVMQWTAQYNGPDGTGIQGLAKSVAVDDNGNVYITGDMWNTEETIQGFVTIKYNKDGIEQWAATYNVPGHSAAVNALVPDNFGNVYITGTIDKKFEEDPDADIITIKYQNNGKKAWAKTFNGPRNHYDEGLSLTVDETGGVYVTGLTFGATDEMYKYDYATVKYDHKGNHLWAAFYNGPANSLDFATSVAVDASHNVFVTGQSAGVSNDYATIKYDADGNEIWVNRYNGPGNGGDEAAWVTLDRQGSVYVTGRSMGADTYYDFATIKYNSAGVEQWVARYNGPGNGFDAPAFGGSAHPIAVDGLGNVYVTGFSQRIGADVLLDHTTIKYSQPLPVCGNKGDKVLVCHKGQTICIPESAAFEHFNHGDVLGTCADQDARFAAGRSSVEINDLPARFRVAVAPNPAAGTTKIVYEMPVEGHVTIKVFDMVGRQITTLVDANKPAGFHNINYNVSALMNGMYYYRITVKSAQKTWSETGKINVIK